MTTTTSLDRGDRFTTDARAVTPGEARTLIDVAGYSHPLFAGSGPPDMLPGQLVLAVLAGLLERSGRLGEDVVALTGLDEVRFRAPVRPGDPLSADVTVVARRATSSPDRQLLVLALAGTVDGATVIDARATFLLRTGPAPPPTTTTDAHPPL
jgi:3-hydroxymyristoyl/3-hydroxydecanoyl-(acyl carrier protein) dehydratase